MKGSKRILILIFSLLFLSSFTLPNLCSAVVPSSTNKGQSSYFNESDHSHHQHSNCNNKIPCPNKHSCCHLVTQSIASYFFALDSYLVTPVEIFFKPSEINKSFYHPPKILL